MAGSAPFPDRLPKALLPAVLAALAAAAFAEAGPLADPTRPPADASGVAGPAGGASSSAVSARPASAVAPRLQSLRLGTGLAPVALVDGRPVRIGDRLGASVVRSITATGLLLSPAVPSVRGAAAAAAANGNADADAGAGAGAASREPSGSHWLSWTPGVRLTPRDDTRPAHTDPSTVPDRSRP